MYVISMNMNKACSNRPSSLLMGSSSLCFTVPLYCSFTCYCYSPESRQITWTILYSKSGVCFTHMLVFTKIIVLYNFRYKKLPKPCTQLLRYKQPVPYLPVNMPAWTIRTLKVERLQCRHLRKVLHFRH